MALATRLGATAAAAPLIRTTSLFAQAPAANSWGKDALTRLSTRPPDYETPVALLDSFIAIHQDGTATVSIEKAERVLGYAPRFSNKDALIRNYRWYLANLSRFDNQSGVTHRVPWKQGILSVAKRFF